MPVFRNQDGSVFRRRDFLKTGLAGGIAAGIAGSLPRRLEAAASTTPAARSCILLVLTGGPSHLDTWDMKPDAPAGIRGPFRPIRTNVPGIEISEIFPLTARHADKFAILRGVHHDSSMHSLGLQLVQTGDATEECIIESGITERHIGSAIGCLAGLDAGIPAHVLLPDLLRPLDFNMINGQNRASLYPWPFIPSEDANEFSSEFRDSLDLSSESAKTRERYGTTPFGQSCLLARRLVESGVRFVTVNMFQTVYGVKSWDSHGYEPFSAIRDYRDTVAPLFDRAYASLLSDLHDRGLLSSTMVVAAGEFGRTPRINSAGGRDHWSYCSSALIAGGGICGGQVVGSSDAIGAFPKHRGIEPRQMVATMYHALTGEHDYGLPIHELFV